jgi:Na+/proline symporter
MRKHILSVLVQNLLPPGLKGIVLAALLAALMSSISSMFNSASTLVARDLVVRFRPNATPRTQILAGQFALVLVMVGGILTTPLIGKYSHLWEYLQEVSAYFSVPFAVVGLTGIFLRRVNRKGAVAAIVTGVALSAFLLAEVMGAQRCVLIKDEQGLYTADPKKDPAAKFIPEIEKGGLVFSGIWKNRMEICEIPGHPSSSLPRYYIQ